MQANRSGSPFLFGLSFDMVASGALAREFGLRMACPILVGHPAIKRYTALAIVGQCRGVTTNVALAVLALTKKKRKKTTATIACRPNSPSEW